MKNYVVIYIIYSNQVYYLRKVKGKINKLDNKLVGLGGKIEKNEDIYQTSIREIQEEMNLEILEEDLNYRGILYEVDEDKTIHFFTLKVDKRIKEMSIENEGNTKYYPLNYHNKFPQEFPKGDVEILNLLFKKKSFFKVSCKDGRITPQY